MSLSGMECKAVLVLLLAGFCGVAAAMPAQSSSASDQPPSAKEDGQVVLHVSVHAQRAQQLANLQAGNLQITDNGRHVDSREISLSANTGDGDRLITVIFDRISPVRRKRAAAIAAKMLEPALKGEAGVGVWTIDTRLHILQSYTLDRIAAANAIRTATNSGIPAAHAFETGKNAPPAPAAGPVNRQEEWESASRTSLRLAGTLVRERTISWNLAALMAAATTQRSLSGRKVILYFTEDSPDDLNAADGFRLAAHQLIDASISLFAVDLNAVDQSASDGMQAGIAMGMQSTANRATIAAVPKTGPVNPYDKTLNLGPGTFAAMNNTMAQLEMGGQDGNKNLIALLAAYTGGVYTNDDAGFRKIGEQIAGELNNYYTLTYAVPADQRDNKYHAVAVHIAAPGIRVLSPTGYIASRHDSLVAGERRVLRSTAVLDSSNFERLLAESTGTGPVIQSAVVRRGGGAATRITIALAAPIAKLDLREDENTNLFSLHASVAVLIKNAAGVPAGTFTQEFRRRGSLDSVESYRLGNLSVERSPSFPPGKYTLEAVVRDWNSGTVGSSKSDFVLDQESGAAPVSDLVLVASTQKGSAGESPNDLVYEGARIIPDVFKQLDANAISVPVFFETYIAPGEFDSPAAEILVHKDGVLVSTLPVSIRGASPEMISVPLQAGSGHYSLTLEMKNAGKVVRRELELNVSRQPATTPVISTEGVTPGQPPDANAINNPLPGAPANAQGLILSAGQQAVVYANTLPNFMCLERVDRSIDPKSKGIWKRRDSIVEMLRYHDGAENRMIVEVDGVKSTVAPDHLEGTRSAGEFGGVLKAIFSPEAAARFTWARTEEADGNVLQVFQYRVEQKNSIYTLTDPSGGKLRTAFGGEVFIDDGTHAVRELSVQTDESPKTFGIRSSWLSIHYNYIAINNHEYLLPTHGEVGLKQGKQSASLNQFHFSNYRRFGARSRFVAPAAIPTE